MFDAYRRFYGQPSGPREAERYLRARLARRESKLFMAIMGPACVGFVQLYPTFSSISMKRLWILNDLFVIPKARRRGAAEALLERARRLAVETRAEGLVLETAIGNSAAQRLYEKLGWTREKQFFRYNLDT